MLEESDGKLLEAIGCGEWSINGFTNADLRPLLLGEDDANAQVSERRRRSGMISRKLASLHDYGLIRPREPNPSLDAERRGADERRPCCALPSPNPHNRCCKRRRELGSEKHEDEDE